MAYRKESQEGWGILSERLGERTCIAHNPEDCRPASTASRVLIANPFVYVFSLFPKASLYCTKKKEGEHGELNEISKITSPGDSHIFISG